MKIKNVILKLEEYDNEINNLQKVITSLKELNQANGNLDELNIAVKFIEDKIKILTKEKEDYTNQDIMFSRDVQQASLWDK